MEDRRHAAWRLGRQSLVLFALLACYHFVLRWLMLHRGLVLGAVGPGNVVYRVVPLYAYVKPHFKTGLLVAVGALVAYWCWVRGRVWNLQPRRRTFVPALVLWHVALACAVAMIDGGPQRLWRPYELLEETDYIGALPLVESARGFLHDYVSLLPELPMHCQVHPPGGVLFLWWVDRYVWPGPAACALATVLAACLAVPAVYGLAREVLDERFARLASCLFLLAPSVMLFTATSMDGVFMVPMAWTYLLLWKARSRKPWVFGCLGGLTAALSAIMTFSAAFLGLWGLAMLLVTALADRRRLPTALQALAGAAASSALVCTALYCWSGYNLLENLQAAVTAHHGIMHGGNYATARQYAHLVVGNLVALFAGVGIPVAVLFFRQALRDARGVDGPSSGRLLSLSFLLALSILAAAPLYTLEVERIWVFMVPLVVISATRLLSSSGLADRPGPEIGLTFCLLSIQVVATEVLLNTIW
ncbi:MAG: hypothetical protein ACYTG0_47650 [Planctomycetota bacterium]|jgi:hypothetical protein